MDDARPVIYLTFNEEESIPWDANIPFPTLESGGGSMSGGVLIDAGGEGSGPADAGGAGGGFDDPGEQIDGALDDAGDGGDGDDE